MWRHIYGWLELNGLWLAVIGWSVTGLLGLAVAQIKPLRKRLFHFLTPEEVRKLPDLLNTNTPGGLGDLMQELRRLPVADAAATHASEEHHRQYDENEEDRVDHHAKNDGHGEDE